MELEDEFDKGIILAGLVKIRPADLDVVQKELILKRVLFPRSLFRQADTEVRDLLLHEIKETSSDDLLSINKLLTALAWVGDEEVQRQFAEWKQNPPSWAEKLYVPVERYANEANWELDQNGTRRDLIFEDNIYSGVEENQEHIWLEERCQCCNRQLAVLFDLDLTKPELQFLGVKGTRLRIATCIQCTCYQTIYTEVDGDGKVRWSPSNVEPKYCYHSPDELDGLTCFAVGQKQEKWSEIDNEEISKIGGQPVWIQDSYFPPCPCCQESMPFIAQHQQEGEEGLIYIHLCSSCQVVATNYDQT